ncbi:hypothetical protein EF879_11990 [Micromonospora sp. HM5-17]|nr:hypothetical protein EF879_11990 [Micromonospora sp. HM5-17]
MLQIRAAYLDPPEPPDRPPAPPVRRFPDRCGQRGYVLATSVLGVVMTGTGLLVGCTVAGSRPPGLPGIPVPTPALSGVPVPPPSRSVAPSPPAPSTLPTLPILPDSELSLSPVTGR